jgi:hypothetical protein
VSMDVAEFFSEFRRMCKSTSDCTKCEYHGDRCDNVIELLEKTIAVVEQWSKEHPRKTRQSVFLEQWPGSEIDESGCLMLCPLSVSAERRNRHGECTTLVCSDCRREFWMQEVE